MWIFLCQNCIKTQRNDDDTSDVKIYTLTHMLWVYVPMPVFVYTFFCIFSWFWSWKTNTKLCDGLRKHELEITHARWLSVCATFFCKTHLSHQREICLEREKQLDEWRNFAVDLHIYIQVTPFCSCCRSDIQERIPWNDITRVSCWVCRTRGD